MAASSSSSSSSSSATALSGVEQLVRRYRQANNCIWLARFDEAEKLCEPYARTVPFMAIGYAEVMFWRALVNETDVDHKTANDRLERAKNVAIKYTDRRSKLKSELKKSAPSQPVLPRKASREDNRELLAQVEAEEKAAADAEARLTTDDSGSLDKEIAFDDSVLDIESQKALYLWAKLVVGEACFFDSMLKLKRQSYVKGVYYFKRAWNVFYELHCTRNSLIASGTQGVSPYSDDVFGGIGFGNGLIQFVVSIFPPQFKFIAEGLGFKGDRDSAMRALQVAVDARSAIRSPGTRWVCVWLHTFYYEDYPAAQALLDGMFEQWPRSPPAAFLGGYHYRKRGMLTKSTELFQLVHDDATDMPGLVLYSVYELGYDAFLQRNWAVAITQLEAFLAKFSGEGFKTYAAFQLAVSYEMMFQRDKANEWMKRLQPWVRKDYAYDEYSGRHAKHFLSHNGFSDFERKYTVAALQVEGCDHEGALESLGAVESLANTADEKAALEWLRATAHYELGHRDEARAGFEACLKMEKAITKYTLHVVPHAYVYLGKLLLDADGKVDDAEKLFKKAKNYSCYDFDQLLAWKQKSALDHHKRRQDAAEKEKAEKEKEK